MLSKGFTFLAIMALILLGACFRPAPAAEPAKITVQLADGTTFGPRLMSKVNCCPCDSCQCPAGSCENCQSCAGCAPCAFKDGCKACAKQPCTPALCRESRCEVGQCLTVPRYYQPPVRVVFVFRRR